MFLGLARRLIPERGPDRELNRYQALFCVWNADRLGITHDDSVARFRRSQRAVRGGHRGALYRLHVELSHALLEPFASDSPTDVWNAYFLHSEAHLLRLLSYAEPTWPSDHPVLTRLRTSPEPTVVDFGCGLAQYSISLYKAMQAEGHNIKLLLADIPTLHFHFLEWFVDRLEIDADLRACDPNSRVPDLPFCDVLIAREFFEHVSDPVWYFTKLDRYVKTGGVLVGDIRDHRQEFMHLSSNLRELRVCAAALGYEEIGRGLLRKGDRPGGASIATGP